MYMFRYGMAYLVLNDLFFRLEKDGLVNKEVVNVYLVLLFSIQGNSMLYTNSIV
jgi:hypothetical protein